MSKAIIVKKKKIERHSNVRENRNKIKWAYIRDCTYETKKNNQQCERLWILGNGIWILSN